MHVTATTVPPMCGPRNYTLVVSKRSICPSRRWLGIREVAEQLDATRQNRTAPVVLLNAGVNKGFELLDLYQIYHGHFNFTGKRWHELLLSTENPQRCLEHCCGVCSTCLKRHLTIPKPLALRQGLPVELYGFDALPANHIMLTWMVARTGLPATLTHAAVGDSVKQVLVQNESAGFENGGPLRGRRGPGPGRVPVPQLTIDAFVAQRGIEYLDHVLIDVEGWDAHVIDGMKGMLTARRIELFEFENSPKCGARWTVHEKPHCLTPSRASSIASRSSAATTAFGTTTTGTWRRPRRRAGARSWRPCTNGLGATWSARGARAWWRRCGT